MILITDAHSDTRKERRMYEKVRRSDYEYSIKLRKIARQVGDIVGAFKPGDPASLPRISALLRKYAELLKPYAEVIAANMLADVSRKDEAVWATRAKAMSAAMREELRRAPTGQMLKALQLEQVKLITSIPLDAAKRVHKLTMEGLADATRASEIAKEILRTTHVTESRATLIARTEVGRASTNLTLARASYVGSDGYVWRTAQDSDVRKSHRKMEGKFVSWAKPPTLDNLTGHAGALPNCRCYPEVVLPNSY